MRRRVTIGICGIALIALLSGCAGTRTPSASIQAQLDEQLNTPADFAQEGVFSLAAGDNLGRQIWVQDVYLATGRQPNDDMLTTVVVVEE